MTTGFIKSCTVEIGSDSFLGEPKDDISKNVFEIPPYQREYTWSTEEWSDLYEDLIDSLDTNREHFIGTFMFIKSEDKDKICFKVVDGQQRITTISLLYLALARIGLENYYKQYARVQEESNGYISSKLSKQLTKKESKLRDILSHIFVAGYRDEDDEDKLSENIELKLSLSHCSNNDSDYKDLARDICNYVFNLEDGENNEVTFATKCDKRRKIWKAYNYFHNKISEEIKDKSPEYICDYVLNLAMKLSKWQTILITTDDAGQAYTLFDSLNNRGVPLSPVDIVKNSLFAKMAKYGIDIDAKQEQWVGLLDRINSEKLLRRFFVDYYNIYYKDYGHTRTKVLTENNIISTYDDLIEGCESKDEILKLYDHLLQISKIYSLIIHPENINPDDYGYGDASEFKYSLIHLNEISAIPSYGFLTFLYDKLELMKIKNDASAKSRFGLFTDIVKMLTKFFAIRHITDVPRVKHLPNLFDKWLQLYVGARISDRFEHYRNSFIAVITDEKKFILEKKPVLQKNIEKLEYEKQKTRTALIRYLFTLYEMNNPETVKIDSLKPYKSLWEHNTETNIGEFKYSIEHIIPEGKNLKDNGWTADLGVDVDYAKRTEFIHKLGNLGLLVPNKEAAQKSFDVKKDYYKTIAYRMFEEDVLTAEKWTRTEVENRTKKLAACMTEYLYEDFAELDTKPDSE